MSKDFDFPAFQIAGHECPLRGEVPCEYGLSARDWFAGMAMQGDWSSQGHETGVFSQTAPTQKLLDRATFYYEMADAMLRVRSK